ncbi:MULTISPECIES: hypothetical protein [Paenibacillus]|uniref:hypothetical protein n=1 Tax=Paenibacillus TaxID=44249 RepID=UPI0022B8F0D8|nr:hypothetical protein [Paenibacillus caseinilyticus]MCZ8524113.1 hypothetical protein [Paenibacillus caseinilyticus]
MTDEKAYEQPREEEVQKQFVEKAEGFEFKVEGLKDGYRFTVKGEEEQVKQQRRVGASFVNFVRQADKAGWRLPWFLRVLLSFWGKYK